MGRLKICSSVSNYISFNISARASFATAFSWSASTERMMKNNCFFLSIPPKERNCKRVREAKKGVEQGKPESSRRVLRNQKDQNPRRLCTRSRYNEELKTNNTETLQKETEGKKRLNQK